MEKIEKASEELLKKKGLPISEDLSEKIQDVSEELQKLIDVIPYANLVNVTPLDQYGLAIQDRRAVGPEKVIWEKKSWKDKLWKKKKST